VLDGVTIHLHDVATVGITNAKAETTQVHSSPANSTL
jgi:hypothetical protein